MMHLHCTRKLLAKLPLTSDGTLNGTGSQPFSPAEGTRDSLAHWYGNLLLLQRRNCVLLIHEQTRFPVFIKAMTKPDFARFNYWFVDALMNTLLQCGASRAQLDATARCLAPFQCDTTINRSLQGTLNQMADSVEHLLVYDSVAIGDLSAYRIGAWLADQPCSFNHGKQWMWPQKAMLELLDTLA